MITKIRELLMIILSLIAILGTNVFAGTLGTNAGGIYYVKDDGLLATSEWITLDLDSDGMLEYYYFDDRSILLTNNTTPDGYQVNERGQWIENGVVKTVSNGNAIPSINANQNAYVSSNNIGYGIICDDVGKVVELAGGKGQVISMNVTEVSKFNNDYKIYYSVIATDVYKVNSSGIPHVTGKIVCYDAYGAPCDDCLFILRSKTTPCTGYFWASQQTVKLAVLPWY